jgi:hypothetical protein
MKGCTLGGLLLTVAIACAGCRASMLTPDSTQVSMQGQSVVASTRLPDTLIGVWYPDDAEGVANCGRYRALSSAPEARDEAIVVLVGSVVVTLDLIHVFSEYGEGDFHVVERVEAESSNTWRITTWLGIDSPPDEQSGEGRVVSRLSLHRGKLRWQSSVQAGSSSSSYFRCAAVREDIHPPMTDGKTVEAVS